MAVYSDHICWHYFGPEVHMLAFSRKQRWKRQTTSNHLLSCLRFLPTDHILQWLLERICWSVKNITHLLHPQFFHPDSPTSLRRGMTRPRRRRRLWTWPWARCGIFSAGTPSRRRGCCCRRRRRAQRGGGQLWCTPDTPSPCRNLTGIRNRIQFPQSITA